MTGGGSGKPNSVMGKSPDGVEMRPYNAGMKGLKGSPDEGGVRVPLFVRWDKHWPAQEIDRIAGDIDIFPTLAAIAGATLPPNQVEGRNLLPLIRDPSAAWEDRYLFTHVGRWDTGQEPNDFQWKNFSVRNQRFRFVNDKQLFDMQADPGQTTNVIDKHADVVSQMRKAYDEWWKVTRPMMVNEGAEMSVTKPFHELYSRQLREKGIPEWNAP
jgi:arylsulfatase